MENKNDTGFHFKNKEGRNKQARTIKIFMFLLCSIFIILLTYIVGGLLILNKGGNINEEQGAQQIFDFNGHFKECTLLIENCLDETCNKYQYCSDKKYKICRVYDCKSSFGIGTEDMAGEIDLKNIEKPDQEKIIAKKADCQGDLEIISKQCVDGKMQIMAKVGTAGECVVSNFVVFFKETGFKTSSFSSTENNQYLITSKYCGELEKIVAVGEGGIAIKEKKF